MVGFLGEWPLFVGLLQADALLLDFDRGVHIRPLCRLILLTIHWPPYIADRQEVDGLGLPGIFTTFFYFLIVAWQEGFRLNANQTSCHNDKVTS